MFMGIPAIRLPQSQAYAEMDLKYNIASTYLYCSSLDLNS